MNQAQKKRFQRRLRKWCNIYYKCRDNWYNHGIEYNKEHLQKQMDRLIEDIYKAGVMEPFMKPPMAGKG